MILPSFDGVSPRSDSRIAFSIALICDGVVRLDREEAGLGRRDRRHVVERRRRPVVVDRDPVEQRRRRAPGADAVELGAGRSIDLSIRRSQSARKSSIAVTQASFGVVTIVPIRSPEATRTMLPSASSKTWIGTLVVHAERERGRVHHPQAALDRLEVRELGQEPRGRVGARITVVDALDAVLRHQDRLGADLERPQRRGRVGREERVAGAGREDHDATLLEVAHRAPADVGLGDLRDGDRRLHARLRAELLERVLERERVQQRREHAGVVGRRAVHPVGRRRHAAVEVAAADDDRELGAGLAHRDDLARRSRRRSSGRRRTRGRPSGSRPRASAGRGGTAARLAAATDSPRRPACALTTRRPRPA